MIIKVKSRSGLKWSQQSPSIDKCPDRLGCVVSRPGPGLHLDSVYVEFVGVSEVIVGLEITTGTIIINCCFTYNAGRAPLLEIGHLSVPGTVLGAFLANPKGLSAKMIFTVQLIRVVIIISVSEQVHSRSSDTINLFYELKGTTALYLHTDFFLLIFFK